MDSNTYGPLTAIVRGWEGKIQLAIQHKRREFSNVADQCMAFFAGGTNFMWEAKYRERYLKGFIAPRFQVTLNKAFELVAIFGPVLYHRNPTRRVQPYKPLDLTPELFGDVSNPQMAQMAQVACQQAQMTQSQEWARKKAGCQLVEHYLNYTPREQPDGGLEIASEKSITEALVKGRGVMWPETYHAPASDRMLTGCFYGTVDNLLTDPDATDFTFGNTRWVCREHISATWELERRFGLPPGTVKKWPGATDWAQSHYLESAESQGATSSSKRTLERQRGSTFDLVRWYEIWSIGGVGTRLTGASKVAQEAFDDVVGDFAYLAIAPGVPYPLNCPPMLFGAGFDEDIKKAFDWPIPYYLDQRWPCAVLDFYNKPNSPWGHAPLASGLGELTVLNIFVSALTNRVWNSCRLITAVLESAKSYVDKELRGGDDIVVMGIKEIHQDINKVISNYQSPDVSAQVFEMIDKFAELFDKRTGLSDLLYGMQTGAQSRSATDISAKREGLSVRPDHMSKKVELFMREAARMEKLCAYWGGVSGKDVSPLLGSVGGQLWDQLVVNADPEVVIREMDATVESGSARRPNKDRDIQNIQSLSQNMGPLAMNYAAATTDTGPLNWLAKMTGDVMDQDMTGFQFGPWAPPPPPPGTPDPAQQQMAMEQQSHQMEMAGKAADLQAKQIETQTDLQAKQAELQMEMAKLQMDLEAKRQELELAKQKNKEDLKVTKAKNAEAVKVAKARTTQARKPKEKAVV